MYTYSSTQVNFKQNPDSNIFAIKDIKIHESQNMALNFTLAEPHTGYIVFVLQGRCELISPSVFFLNTNESCLFVTTTTSTASFRSLPNSKVCVIRFNLVVYKVADLLIWANADKEHFGSSIIEFIQILLSEYQRQQDNWIQICSYLLRILFALYQRFASMRLQPTAPADNLSAAEAVKQYIDSHYMEKINISAIAKSLFISESTVSHNFVSAYRITVAKYILQVRINESKRYLEQTSLPIEEISDKVGFSSLTTFYRNFNQYTGMSPGEYRNQYQSQT